MTSYESIVVIPPAFDKMKFFHQPGITVKRLGPDNTELTQQHMGQKEPHGVSMTDAQLLQLRDYLNDLFEVEK